MGMTLLRKSRRSPVFAAAAIAGTVGALVLAAGSGASAATKQTWNLSADMGSHPARNPAPDKYGHSKVWYFLSGALDEPGTFRKLPFVSPASLASECGYPQTYAWEHGFTYPVISYNQQAIPATNPCLAGEHSSAVAAHTVVVGPTLNESDQGVVMEWKPPISGTVTLSGSLTGMQSCETGITYEVDQGTSTLIAGNEVGNQTASFKSLVISVKTGQPVYLEIVDAPGSDGSCDNILVTFTITRQQS